MITGARQGKVSGIRRLFAKAMANDLNVFVVPGLDIARSHGLDVEAAGMQVVVSPRHASVLFIIGDISAEMCEAASVVYAQMLRPKTVLVAGIEKTHSPLPKANVSINISQADLMSGVQSIRDIFETKAFQAEVEDYHAPALQVQIEYVCPMHPEVVKNEPGDCPKCGMFLVPRETQANTKPTLNDSTISSHSPAKAENENEHSCHHEKETEYSCPMHPEIVQNKPGDCPKCGMYLELKKDPVNDKLVKEKKGHQAMHNNTSLEYTCPMHPEVVQSEPGDCPKCGMHLEPREIKTESHHEHQHTQHAASLEYTCPMHPEVVQNEPGKCPKCGMNLEPREIKTESHHEHQHTQHAASLEYTCPMHPEVVQNEPGDCPKCGMHLEPREIKTESHHEHQHTQHASSLEYTCPMHPEVVQNEPGKCPKCGMNLEPKKIQSSTSHIPTDKNHSNHNNITHDNESFMSMIDVTKDLPRSSDDLQMEWIDAAFGPFFPGLPSGLQLKFSLDGDTVAGSVSHSIAKNADLLKSSPMHAGCFVKDFLTLDPLTPVSSQLLICQTIENAAGIKIDENTAKARIGALERERIASHLNWLVLFAQQTGFAWLSRRAGLLQLKFLEAELKQIIALKPAIMKLVKQIRNTPLLKPRTSGIGQIFSNEKLCGVVARATNINNDVRSNDEIYLSLGFESIKRKEGDAWARLQVRLDEMNQSLALIEAAGNIALPEMIKLDDISGTGESQIESPRGELRLQLSLDKGYVTSVNLQTPSSHHLSLIETLTDQQELGDALIAVGSLDLSPWEIRQ